MNYDENLERDPSVLESSSSISLLLEPPNVSLVSITDDGDDTTGSTAIQHSATSHCANHDETESPCESIPQLMDKQLPSPLRRYSSAPLCTSSSSSHMATTSTTTAAAAASATLMTENHGASRLIRAPQRSFPTAMVDSLSRPCTSNHNQLSSSPPQNHKQAQLRAAAPILATTRTTTTTSTTALNTAPLAASCPRILSETVDTIHRSDGTDVTANSANQSRQPQNITEQDEGIVRILPRQPHNSNVLSSRTDIASSSHINNIQINNNSLNRSLLHSSSSFEHSPSSRSFPMNSRLIHRSSLPNIAGTANTAVANNSNNVKRLKPVAQGEWKTVPFNIPPYFAASSSPPSPRSLHAAAMIQLPLGMIHPNTHYSTLNSSTALSAATTTNNNTTNILAGREHSEHHSHFLGDTNTYHPNHQITLELSPKVESLLLLFGGYDGQARRNDLFGFDFRTQCWSLLSPNTNTNNATTAMNNLGQEDSLALNGNANINSFSSTVPKPRDRHIAVTHGTTFYVFGGFDGTSRINDFWGYDFRTRAWRQIFARPQLRTVPILTTTNNNNNMNHDPQNINLHRVGGDVHAPAMTTTVLVQPEPPSPRHSHCASVYKNGIYIFGGYDGSYRSDFHVFDIDREEWRIVDCNGGRVPRSRYRATCIVHDDAFLIFGGHDGIRHLSDIHIFDFLKGIWFNIETSIAPIGGVMTLPGSPSSSSTRRTLNTSTNSIGILPRDSHVSVKYRDCMYVFGGSTGSAMNDMWELTMPTRDPDGKSWSTATWRPVSGKGSIPTHRFCHVGVVYQDSLFVFGGYDGNTRLNDFIRFQFEVDDLGCEVPPSTLIDDLRSFLHFEHLTDVTFIVEGQKIKAHKILLMRCPYFNAMFSGDMKESKQTVIPISDIRCSTFTAILEYLYTDEVTTLTSDNAMELFIAADLYGLIRLQVICENCLLESISVENAATLFHAADIYSAVSLRSKTLKYILSHFEAVTKTVAFEDMARANVELVFEILKSPR